MIKTKIVSSTLDQLVPVNVNAYEDFKENKWAISFALTVANCQKHDLALHFAPFCPGSLLVTPGRRL